MSTNVPPPAATSESWTTSNVRVISNVFPIAGKHLRKIDLPGVPPHMEGVFNDKNFRLQARGKAALKELARHTGIWDNDEHLMRRALMQHGEWQDHQGEVRWVEDWQIELYFSADGGGRCADCPEGARPIGIGWIAGGRTIEIRCEETNCRCR